MQKIYVLLRNDQQTGPYSLEEIIQFNLKPFDLIWIEGKSAGWYYPQEISALHPYLDFMPKQPKVVTVPKASANAVFVAMPAAAKATEPTPVENTGVFSFASHTTESPSKTGKQLEEEVYAQFRTAPKVKEPVQTTNPVHSKKAVSPIVVGTLTVLIVGGVFAASWMLNRKPAETNVPLVVQQEAAGEGNELVQPDATALSNTPVTSTKSLPKQTAKTRTAAKQATATQTPVFQSEPVRSTKQGNSNPSTDDAAVLPSEEKENTVEEESAGTRQETTTEQPQEKKKSLRDRFLDLFKKKPEEKPAEESRQAETAKGERTSTRRESDANLAQLVHVRFDVPNDWMMGIKGAKAILINRSSQDIATATIEVLYYDDDNNLLQKKTVTFSKIDGKESKTLTIPDHNTATKVDYNVISVVGKPAA